MLEFNASICGGEVPVCLGVIGIALLLPSGDFVDECLFVGNAAVEALGGRNAEFGFCEVKPTAMFGRVAPLEAFNQPPRFGGWESLVE